MKIFISWSGNKSKEVAQLFGEWLQDVIQVVEPWFSSRDIEKGTVWFTEISDQLAKTNLGIICLTKNNKNEPWILFESGALVKGLKTNRVFTFLIDIKPEEIKGPLAQFNHTFPNKDSILQMLIAINKSGDNDSFLKEERLKKIFDKYWPEFDEKFQHILSKKTNSLVHKIKTSDDTKYNNLNFNNDEKISVVLGQIDYLDKLRNQSSKNIAKVQVKLEDIVFFTTTDYIDYNAELKSLRNNYIWFETVHRNERYFLRTSLKKISKKLPNNFQRINNSYIINTDPNILMGINNLYVFLKNRKIVISPRYKNDLMKKLDKINFNNND